MIICSGHVHWAQNWHSYIKQVHLIALKRLTMLILRKHRLENHQISILPPPHLQAFSGFDNLLFSQHVPSLIGASSTCPMFKFKWSASHTHANLRLVPSIYLWQGNMVTCEYDSIVLLNAEECICLNTLAHKLLSLKRYLESNPPQESWVAN